MRPPELRRQVVLFTSSYCMGGIEAHLGDLTEGLIKRGWQVAVICSTLPDIEPLRRRLAKLGASVHPVAAASRPWQLPGRALRIARALRRYRRPVLHLHLQGDAGGLLVLVAGRLVGIAAAVRTLHNPPVPPISRGLRLAVAVTDRLVERIVCVSPETRRAQLRDLQRDARKCVVIPNGVDVERFSPSVSGEDARRELGFRPDEKVVGTVARLQEERKGVSDFVAMAGRVVARLPDTRFLVVGDGPLRVTLERQAEGLGLSGRMVFAGYRDDVPRMLAAMDVAVFPSSYEAAQYVMLEAMASARPVVLTPAGLAIDLIQPGATGVLVPIHDVGGLARAVEGLLEDHIAATRMGLAARQVVVDSYSTDAMVSSAIELYAEVTDLRSSFRTAPAGAADLR